MNTQGHENDTSHGNGEAIRISFDPIQDGVGLLVTDPIERRQYSLATTDPVTPTSTSTEQFQFPVDAAVTITTESITLPTVVAVYVRDEQGDLVAETEHLAHEELPAGTYSIELCAPIKLYLQVASPVTVTADAMQTQLLFGETTAIRVGARSRHERPAATITTTTAPEDMMAAVSAFGSALKTTTPERAYPTLRGHPPTVELGETLAVPSGLESPATGIRLAVPPTYRSIYVAAPLAYYLGATLVPREIPRLITDTGFEYRLAGPAGFETTVERALKHVFFFDCVTRTEGHYPVALHERQAIESKVDLDFATLYDQPLAEQLESYLSVPYAMVEPHIPDWKLTTHISPTPESFELLPFVVDDLAIVRTPKNPSVAQSAAQATAVDDYLRAHPTALTRSTSGQTESASTSFVQPESTASIEQMWIGDGMPVGASKASIEAFRNRITRTPTEDDITITVVCNDAEMHAERDTINRVYGSRETLPFEVTVERNVTTAELRALLASEAEFLHYIGHIDDAGFDCADGTLDAATLDTVNIDAFLLNACQSYKQGMELLKTGSIGGVVTLNEVINSGAVRIGCAMAQLLNRGFPLQAALEIAQDESIVGGQYIVVGDGTLAITQAESGIPNVCRLERAGDDFRVTFETYPTSQFGLGSLVMPHLETNNRYFLGSGDVAEFEVSKSTLAEFLQLEDIPVKVNGQLHWSRDLELETL